MAASRRWARGWDDVLPLAILVAPMLLDSTLYGLRGLGPLVAAGVGAALGLAVKHLTGPALRDLALAPPAAALLYELAVLPLTLHGILLAAVAGVGLLLWAGAEPSSGIPLGVRLEPALVPALAVGLAVGVMLFLPGGTGGQVGLAALVLVGVLGLTAWVYLRSAADVESPASTPS